MAKIVEDILVVKFSRIVKESETDIVEVAGSDIQQALEQVAQELAGEAVVVEVMKA
jgi:histone H3/H4